MSATKSASDELVRELSELSSRYHTLADDDVFILWYLLAQATDDPQRATEALTGGPNDKNVDAVFIDDQLKVVLVVQGKYRKNWGTGIETRSDVLSFADLAATIAGPNQDFAHLVNGMEPRTRALIQAGRERVKRRGYRLQLVYASTGRVSDALEHEARQRVRRVDGDVKLYIEDAPRLAIRVKDYLDGVAPPVPSLDLEIEIGKGIQTSGPLSRYDANTGIEAWLFSMNGSVIAELYERVGARLFARNIRGFLGVSTPVNKSIQQTIENEPEYFWYYNNGITIVCNDARQVKREGRDILQVDNPQIINGQQTSRQLHHSLNGTSKVSVLVKVIRVPRDTAKSAEQFDQLVSRIVQATNWQNRINASDLVSNDRRQIQLGRNLRNVGYYYLRKKVTKSEAKKEAGKHYKIVKKEDLARAVAACELESWVGSSLGKEALFEAKYYPQVFPTEDPYFYLTRYWAMRHVSYGSKGYPERYWAKWVVLHFMWKSIAPLVRPRGAANSYTKIWDEYWTCTSSLVKAIDLAYMSALAYYRVKRAKDQRGTDLANFFKRRGIDAEFERFFFSIGNKRRTRFEKEWKKFEKRFLADMEGG